jgi:hypothetical protein
MAAFWQAFYCALVTAFGREAPHDPKRSPVTVRFAALDPNAWKPVKREAFRNSDYSAGEGGNAKVPWSQPTAHRHVSSRA